MRPMGSLVGFESHQLEKVSFDKIYTDFSYVCLLPVLP